MLDIGRVELRIRPAKPYERWAEALKIQGYEFVGVDVVEREAVEFQRVVGERVKCFLLSPGDGLPFLDSCGLAEASKRRKPPALLVAASSDRISELDAYLAAHPNRIEALEVSLADVRSAYEGAPGKAFDWTAALARAGSLRGIPLVLSSTADEPGGLATPLTKRAFGSLIRSGSRPSGVRERRFYEKLEGVASSRRRNESR